MKSEIEFDLFGDPVPVLVEETVTKPKENILFDILNDLYYQKFNMMRIDPDRLKKEYSPYVINRFVKGNIDCLLDAQQMNLNPFLDKELQYDYYIYALSKKKRYSKYNKKDKEEELMKYLKDYFSFSTEKSKVALSLLSEETKGMLYDKYTQHEKQLKSKSGTKNDK
jgi:hypothetical protein